MHKTDTSYDNSFEENSENIHADSTYRTKRTHKSTETQTDSHCEIERADKASQTNEACSIRVSYCTLYVVCIFYFLCHPVEFMKVVSLVAIGYIGYLILFSRVGKAIQTYVSSSQPTVVSNKTNYSLRNDRPISEENNHLQETSKRGVRRKTASSSIVDKPLRDETTSRPVLAVTDRSQMYESPDKTLSNQRKNYQDKSNSVKTSIPHGDRFIEKDNISSPNTCISEKSSRADIINSPRCILLGNKRKEPAQTTSSLKHRFRSDKNEERLTSRIEDNKTDKTKTYKVGPFDSGTKKSKQPIADYFQSEKREEKTTVYMTGISCKCKRLPKKEIAIAASSKGSNSHKVGSARATSITQCQT
ncbi:hypothetical protein FSP39_010376 [Pinctada imbricata]|uniref:Uncharacterized protein n=1 Tax=Pinctada imbricata TaxID=66713 RepID=A0AA89C127_PINIB|nr:hypothetical protein FSP39_010376 [Pinctada imbricata]